MLKCVNIILYLIMTNPVHISEQKECKTDNYLEKAITAFKVLSIEEKKIVLQEISEFDEVNWTNIFSIINKVRINVAKQIKDKRSRRKITKIKINDLEKKDSPTKIKSWLYTEEEKKTIINNLAKEINLKFWISTFTFIDFFYDNFLTLYYFLLTDETLKIGEYFPSWYKFNDIDNDQIISSFESYIVNNVPALKILEVNNNVKEILKNTFPNADEKRIKAFINKTKLPITILGIIESQKKEESN